jgi:lambda family phage portal protein
MPKQNRVDRAINYLMPGWAASREESRARAAYYKTAMEMSEGMRRNQGGGGNTVYRAADKRRTDSSWAPSSSQTGTREITRVNQRDMRDRCRDAERNNAVAKGLLTRCVQNVVGEGLTIKPLTADEEFNKIAEEGFHYWADHADIRGLQTWRGLQENIFRAFIRDGDCGLVLVDRGEEYGTRKTDRLRLQAVEGDQIDNPYAPSFDWIKRPNAVHIDAYMRPISFDICTWNDNNVPVVNNVAARDFIFYSNITRLNGVRGEPVMQQSLDWLDHLDGLLEAVIVATRMAACVGLLIKRPAAANAMGGLQRVGGKANTLPEFSMRPGMVQVIGESDEVTQIMPSFPGGNLPEFTRLILRMAGLPMGMPLEFVLLDFTTGSYSASRAALMQAYRTFRGFQASFADTVVSRIYRWWVSSAVKFGQIALPPEIRQTYWKHRVSKPGWSWIDPNQEIQAAGLSIDLGLNTLTAIAADHGHDIADIFEMRQTELAAAAAKHIPLSKSSASRDPAGPAPTFSSSGSGSSTTAGQPQTAPAAPAPQPGAQGIDDSELNAKPDDDDGE